MGEEAKQEQAPVEAKPTAEEAKAEERKEEVPKPPTPIVLQVDLHCMGCAKKIERSIMKLKGVDRAVVDMGQNQITINGAVDPQAVCAKITKKVKRSARVLSPLPAPAEADPAKPDVVASEAGGLLTVELNVNMHCEACAVQLRQKILKLRGVQTVEVELSSGKVKATGTMDADKLVNHVYRRTRKQARIVSQPAPEEAKKDGEDEKPTASPEDSNKEAAAPTSTQPEEKKDENGKEGNKAESAGGDEKGEEISKDEKKTTGEGLLVNPPPAASILVNFGFHSDEENMKKMMTHYDQSLCVIERIPPPQLFSDENPNACCIS